MKIFRINDDVQKTIEQNISDCKRFYFISCNALIENKTKKSNIWLLSSATTKVLQNFVDLVEDKYGNHEKFKKKNSRVKNDHSHVFLVLE